MSSNLRLFALFALLSILLPEVTSQWWYDPMAGMSPWMNYRRMMRRYWRHQAWQNGQMNGGWNQNPWNSDNNGNWPQNDWNQGQTSGDQWQSNRGEDNRGQENRGSWGQGFQKDNQSGRPLNDPKRNEPTGPPRELNSSTPSSDIPPGPPGI
ncbi:hypothetical protein M3Y94_00861700 [Aphelenchoides besseyi]|nr:hypothetical protein M3Y94_00861700 [Aphelenchoides besseyi]KAI6226743.1 hypothetical protein M3Y95_00652900 [Aphelenchoides besseyi]